VSLSQLLVAKRRRIARVVPPLAAWMPPCTERCALAPSPTASDYPATHRTAVARPSVSQCRKAIKELIRSLSISTLVPGSPDGLAALSGPQAPATCHRFPSIAFHAGTRPGHVRGPGHFRPDHLGAVVTSTNWCGTSTSHRATVPPISRPTAQRPWATTSLLTCSSRPAANTGGGAAAGWSGISTCR
jgi:hypothetical protein